MNRWLHFLAGLLALALAGWSFVKASSATGLIPLGCYAVIAVCCAVLYRDLAHDALTPDADHRSRFGH
jgi:hypothetical protein